MSTSSERQGQETMSTSSEPRERLLHELLSHSLVDLYVGPENTHWILHEKLLCHRSAYFRAIFYQKKGTKPSAYGLPDVDDEPFRLFVAWLYADTIPAPQTEADLAPLLDLYLMSEKWSIDKLGRDVLAAVRHWYHDTDSWPGLRRVQYVYANAREDSPLRALMVQCVARMLVCGSGEMPKHWEKALRNDGRLAVDVILCVQKWRVDADAIPDARSEEAETSSDVRRVDEKLEQDVGIDGPQPEEAPRDEKNGLSIREVELEVASSA